MNGTGRLTLAIGLLVAACGADATGVATPDDSTDPPGAPTDSTASGGTVGAHISPVALDAAAPGDTYHGLPLGLVQTGTPDVTPLEGKIVVISIGMSNGKQEFERFVDRYSGSSEVAQEVVLVNCAKGGNALESWTTESAPWEACKRILAGRGLNPDQVRVVWAKNANANTVGAVTLPSDDADYYHMISGIEQLVSLIGQHFPSVQAIYHSSRSYGGYVRERAQSARGEPISYEGGLAVNAVLQRWKDNGSAGIWMGWGPYIWADGETPNGTGMTWSLEDFEGDGTDPHPSDLGEDKVADALHARFLREPWYAR